MRRLRGAFERLSSFESLWQASRRGRRGKRFSRAAATFEHDLEGELVRLHEELRAGTFRFSGYRTFTIEQPVRREIRAAPYRDRVVHHAICGELEPVVERHLIHDTFACRLGKGSHRALDRLQHFLRRGTWVVKVDVRKYFFTIDHGVLLEQLRRLYHDPCLDALLTQLLSTFDAGPGFAFGVSQPAPHGGGGGLHRPRGLPIGNLTSQLFANFYLGPVDRLIREEMGVRHYVRYMDDFVLVAPDRRTAKEWKRAVEVLLKARWLTPHPRKTQILPVHNGVRFLGFRVYPHHRRILRDNLKRFTRRMRKHAQRVSGGRADVEAVSRSLNSWLGWVGDAEHSRLLNEVLAPIRFQPPGSRRPWSFMIPEESWM